MAGRRFERAVSEIAALQALWDVDANDADPTGVGAKSSRRRFWRCRVAADHRWSAAPAAISRSLSKGYTGCPACAGRQLSVTNSFAARHPDGVWLWHPRLNGDLTPDRVLVGSPEPVWWRCSAGADHEWQCAPLVMGRYDFAARATGCPFCAGKRPSLTNSVAVHPQLSREWHPEKNDAQPDQVVASSGRKLWWRCTHDPEHEWQATGANRVRGRGCPHCKKSLRSVLEVCLAFELPAFVPEVDLNRDKVVLGGVLRHVDLLDPSRCVVIEVDGRHRHAGPEAFQRDRRKTEALTAAGYRVLRVREQPLQAVTDEDVMVPRDATVKETADAVLTRLNGLGWVPLPGLAEYLAEAEPRRLDLALAHVRAERPGRSIRLPGPVAFTRAGRWEQALEHLRAYVEREGHANVPFEHVEEGFALGPWVQAKRARHQRGRLEADRAAALQALPGWTWDAVADQWERGYQALLAFRAGEGHLDVPAHHWEPDGFPLGSWVRSHRRRGGRRSITEEQRTRLEAIPGWTYQAPTQARWETARAALHVFAEREGHCRTPRQHQEHGVDIEAWSKQQRARHHSGQLSADRVSRLEQVPGWSWSPQEDTWERGFAALRANVAATGTAGVHRDEVRDGYPVGAWVGEQRTRHTRGVLDAERRERLEALPGWSWAPHADSWERYFQALEEFVAREGHARVPTGHQEAGLPLAVWVIRHRQDHKAGRVPPDRVARLEAQPGWCWDVRAARWEEHVAALQRFVEREGHPRVPGAHVEDGVKLGQWLVTTRYKGRTGQLPEDRRERLEQLPRWTWQAHA